MANPLTYNKDWLLSEIALEDAILNTIRVRKYSHDDDYATAAKSRERINSLLLDLGGAV